MVKAKAATLQRLVIPLASGRAETEWQRVNRVKRENKAKTWELPATGPSAGIEDLLPPQSGTHCNLALPRTSSLLGHWLHTGQSPPGL